jgi:hypothetical protein
VDDVSQKKATALKYLHYLDERQRYYTVDRLASQLERLGYRVPLEPVAATQRELFLR